MPSLDSSDADHAACRKLIEASTEPLVIPAPVIVEVDYWIHVRMHAGVLVALLDDVLNGAYRVEELQRSESSQSLEALTHVVFDSGASRMQCTQSLFQ